MFETVFWATGAFILSIVLWQVIFAAVAYSVAAICWLVVGIVWAPYYLAVGIWYAPRTIYRCFVSSPMGEFLRGAAICLAITGLLTPIFWGSL